MAEPGPARSLKRVWIWALILVVIVWVVYALVGGPSTPMRGTSVDSVAPSGP
jgi:hypothetical protein